MKKKHIWVIMWMTMFLMLLFGCSTAGVLPYGVWESEEPYILLDIEYDPDDMHRGKYDKNGEVIDVILLFRAAYKGLELFDLSANEGESFSSDDPYFAGDYTYTKDKLTYTLYPYWQEKQGYKTITFTKIKDYEIPPNNS